VTTAACTEAIVTGVNGNIVSVRVDSGRITKNEIGYVCTGDEKLKAEVLRVDRNLADLQVYEETGGVKVGDRVELTGHQLSAIFGPGLLGTVYDGLQNPLRILADRDGFFLKRGRYVDPLDRTRKWNFHPTCKVGDRLRAGQMIGQVAENRFQHKIVVPFHQTGAVEILSLHEGEATVDDPIARVRTEEGFERNLTMTQEWPVRKSVPTGLVRARTVDRLYPSEPVTTTIRLIDTFFPIAKGGTACIPGPFGAGKTVLQSLISRYSSVDVVIVVACGERAGEVVETLHEFARMQDPSGGGALMNRTIIICNTSSMPVAARESSIYMGIALGEYYRHMGLDVLLLADSTSRWAQAMRETSGRLEEIPGEEAFPAYLDSAIKSVYERAGVFRMSDGSVGSLTMVGTVSPAGGNFDEPVTQSTLGTVKTFLALSYDRAYKRFYPAVDPLISWSRYLGQLRPYYEQHFQAGWTDSVERMQNILRDGDGVQQMMQVTGEEGIAVEDFVLLQKAIFVDMVFLQQDAFDKVDVSMPLDRQKESFLLVCDLVDRQYAFKDKEDVRSYFTRLTGLFKNLNYAEYQSAEYKRLTVEIRQWADTRTQDALQMT
jgi:V/A-type H+-transporting ATPase subunit A